LINGSEGFRSHNPNFNPGGEFIFLPVFSCVRCIIPSVVEESLIVILERKSRCLDFARHDKAKQIFVVEELRG
jgi:hypothetical protein